MSIFSSKPTMLEIKANLPVAPPLPAALRIPGPEGNLLIQTPLHISNFVNLRGSVPLRQPVQPTGDSHQDAQVQAEHSSESLKELRENLELREAQLGISAVRNDYLAVTPDRSKEKVGIYAERPNLQSAPEAQMDIGYPKLSWRRATIQEPQRPTWDRPWEPLPLFESRLLKAHTDFSVEESEMRELWAFRNSVDETEMRGISTSRTLSRAQVAMGKMVEDYREQEFAQSGDQFLLKLSEKPNVSVGAFNKAEVDDYFEKQRQEILRGLRSKGWNKAAIDQMQEHFLGMTPTELDEPAEEGRPELIETGKRSPPKKRSAPRKAKGRAVKASGPPEELRKKVLRRTVGKRKAGETSEPPFPAAGDETASPRKRQRKAPVKYEG